MVAARVHEGVERIAGARGGVDHHRLGMSIHHVDPVRHRHRGVLVRDHHRLRNGGTLLLTAREGLDDRREVGAGIGEEVVDAVRLEGAQQHLR